MAELTPIPTDQRHAYYDALLAGRAEAERLGVHLVDDRIFLAFHRALYRPMLDAHGERIARAIEVAQGLRCPECGGKPGFRNVVGAQILRGCGAGHRWSTSESRPVDTAAIARRGGA